MENNFEKLFEANRGAFEKEEPEAGIWHNLSGKLQEYHTAKQRQQKLWMTKWVAAAILLLMAGAAALIFIPGKRQNAIAQQDKKNIIPPAGMQQPVEEDTGATKDKTVMEKTPAPIGPRSAVAQLDEPGEIKYY
ncbi:MAG TPA: hypothetical protein VHB48_21055, partial [Chitinophagaceae bacterium]|nr:hypothetical protein [Chitinophagaceae bacterium]